MDETIKTDTAAAAVVRGHRKTRVGNVISDAQNKTIVVEIVTRSAHPRYKKVVKSHVRYAAHDENNEAKIGLAPGQNHQPQRIRGDLNYGSDAIQF